MIGVDKERFQPYPSSRCSIIMFLCHVISFTVCEFYKDKALR